MFKLIAPLKTLWAQVKEVIMSLIYTDKDNASRSNPSLNVDDNVSDRLAHGTTQAQNSINDVDVDRLSIQERQILAINNNVNKAVFGFLEDGSFGFKVAPDGTDVLTASDSELIFNSSQNVFKIVAKLTRDFSISTGGTGAVNSFSLTHDLGYEPLTFGSLNITSSSGGPATGISSMPYTLPAINSTVNAGVIAASIVVSQVTTSQVFFTWVLWPNASIVGTITLYVLQETAT